MKESCEFVMSLDSKDEDQVQVYFRFTNKYSNPRTIVTQYVWTMHTDTLSDFCEPAYWELTQHKDEKGYEVIVNVSGELITND